MLHLFLTVWNIMVCHEICSQCASVCRIRVKTCNAVPSSLVLERKSQETCVPVVFMITCSCILWQWKTMHKRWPWRIDTWILAKWILCFQRWVKGFIPRKVADKDERTICQVLTFDWRYFWSKKTNFEVSPCEFYSFVAFVTAVQQREWFCLLY